MGNIFDKIELMKKILLAILLVTLWLLLLFGTCDLIFEKVYEGRALPNVFVGGINVSAWTQNEIENYFSCRDSALPCPFKKNITFIFKYEGREWIIDTEKLNFRLDAQKLARNALKIGRQTKRASLRDTIHVLAEQARTFFRRQNVEAVYVFDERALDKFLDGIASEIDIVAVDAVLDYDGEKVREFEFAKNGRRAETEKIKKIITEFLLGDTNRVKSLKTIAVPVAEVTPQISSEALYKLGIKELIGTGVSYFFDSIPSRVYNIKLAAAKFNGVLVKPGETFSFLKYLGNVSKLEGYKEAYIIKDGKTVLGDGGGVCQVSTTFYRAALYSGLPVLERTAHAYRVSYYEPPIGLDATIYQPGGPDLKFKNDTGQNILIQTFVDEAAMSLTVEFYGTSDGRVTQVSDPVVVSTTPAPATKYQDDPSLPAGQEKQIDTAHAGAKVYFTRRVLRENEVLIDEKIWSNYIPWAAVVARGTKQ